MSMKAKQPTDNLIGFTEEEKKLVRDVLEKNKKLFEDLAKM